MRILLLAFFGAAFGTGVVVLQNAKSAIHEIEAFLLFLIAAVFLVGAAIIEGINRSRRKMEDVIEAEISGATKKFGVLIESAGLGASNMGTVARLLNQHLPALAEKAARVSPPPAEPQKAGPSKPYYYSVDGGQLGPYTLGELRELRASGVIGDKTLVFKKGDTEWRKLTEFSECVA